MNLLVCPIDLAHMYGCIIPSILYTCMYFCVLYGMHVCIVCMYFMYALYILCILSGSASMHICLGMSACVSVYVSLNICLYSVCVCLTECRHQLQLAHTLNGHLFFRWISHRSCWVTIFETKWRREKVQTGSIWSGDWARSSQNRWPFTFELACASFWRRWKWKPNRRWLDSQGKLVLSVVYLFLTDRVLVSFNIFLVFSLQHFVLYCTLKT